MKTRAIVVKPSPASTHYTVQQWTKSAGKWYYLGISVCETHKEARRERRRIARAEPSICLQLVI